MHNMKKCIGLHYEAHTCTHTLLIVLELHTPCSVICPFKYRVQGSLWPSVCRTQVLELVEVLGLLHNLLPGREEEVQY